MNEFLSSLVEQVRAMPRTLQLSLGVAALASMVLVWWVSGGLGTRDFRPLYRGLSEEEAVRVTDALRGENIEYQLLDAATTVAVPAELVHEARMRVAGKGLPSGSGNGFELFDRPAFGVTDFVHRVNYSRAVQGELARSIERLDPVERARVQVVIPERSGVLAAARREPRASVVVSLAPGRELDSNQVSAIVHLVASSIESLQAEHVTLVDGAGRLLAPQGDGRPGPRTPGSGQTHQARVEAELAARIEAILEPVVGRGGVVARVSADMDWTESETTEERFDPDSQIARSETRTDEASSEGGDGGAPGVISNSAGGSASAAEGGGSTRSSETFNYEISKTVTRQVAAVGSIKRLSVAVLVDTDYSGAAAGEATSTEEGATPRGTAWSAEELQRFEELAIQAVGYSKERGDQIVVTSAPFRRPEPAGEEGFTLDPALMILISQSFRILAQLGAILLFAQFIVRPFLRALSATAEQAATLPALPTSVAAMEAALEGGSGAGGALEGGRAHAAIPDAPLTLAEELGAEAGMRSEDSVTTIRNWLNQA